MPSAAPLMFHAPPPAPAACRDIDVGGASASGSGKGSHREYEVDANGAAGELKRLSLEAKGPGLGLGQGDELASESGGSNMSLVRSQSGMSLGAGRKAVVVHGGPILVEPSGGATALTVRIAAQSRFGSRPIRRSAAEA